MLLKPPSLLNFVTAALAMNSLFDVSSKRQFRQWLMPRLWLWALSTVMAAAGVAGMGVLVVAGEKAGLGQAPGTGKARLRWPGQGKAGEWPFHLLWCQGDLFTGATVFPIQEGAGGGSVSLLSRLWPPLYS